MSVGNVAWPESSTCRNPQIGGPASQWGDFMGTEMAGGEMQMVGYAKVQKRRESGRANDAVVGTQSTARLALFPGVGREWSDMRLARQFDLVSPRALLVRQPDYSNGWRGARAKRGCEATRLGQQKLTSTTASRQ
jgi:hypothetical protein